MGELSPLEHPIILGIIEAQEGAGGGSEFGKMVTWIVGR